MPDLFNRGDQPLKIALGTDNFKEMVTQYDVYVDKTLFIKEVLDSSEKTMLITHPRRWGKTLNLNMLKLFLEPETEECKKTYWTGNNYLSNLWELGRSYWGEKKVACNKDIFLGNKLAISSVDNGHYMKYQGKHPVIFITLKDITGDTIEEITNTLKIEVKTLYRDFRYILDSNELHEDERKDFNKYIDIDYDDKKITLENSIKFLCELLHKYHGNKEGEEVYILVDEVDKPVNAFLEKNLGKKQDLEQSKLVTEISKLISQTLCSPLAKTNKHVKTLILTGIFDTIHREAGSGCNNISPYGISDTKFSKNFGFSEGEVKKLISQFSFENNEDIFHKITSWYDGYYIPVDKGIYSRAYTPWAVMKYLNAAYSNSDLVPQNYWTKSGASTILQRLFTKEKCLNSTLSHKLLELSDKATFRLKFDNKISLFKYDWYLGADHEEFFSYLLLNSGYLTMKKDGDEFIFSIPNAELLEEFKSVISKNDEDCSVIFGNLAKPNYLINPNYVKALSLIKEDNSSGIISEINLGNVKCNDNIMNFNFLQLSIIFSKKAVFEALQNSAKCRKELNEYKDKVFELSALDYAFILERSEFMDYYRNDSNSVTTLAKLQDNSKLMHSLCHSIVYLLNGTVSEFLWSGSRSFLTFKTLGIVASYNAGAVAGAGVAVAADADVGLYNRCLSHLKDLAIFTVFISRPIIESVKLITFSNCKKIFEYEAINITSPRDFDSLKQYEKYLMEEGGALNAYVTANGECNQKDEKLTELKANIFQGTYYPNETITFILCEEVQEHQADEL